MLSGSTYRSMAELIKAIRDDHVLTQDEMAARAGDDRIIATGCGTRSTRPAGGGWTRASLTSIADGSP
ncbi:MAG: hypothetical protein M3Y48_12885 [Actinomycetota bacterium]|nr:hypothetical protein [Actinomycetota bacterium]